MLDNIKTLIKMSRISIFFIIFFFSFNVFARDKVLLLADMWCVYLEDTFVVNEYSSSKNITNLRNSGNVLKDPLNIYIAFPKQKPRSQEFAKLICDTTVELKANAKYDELAKKYNMKNF